ncbi:glycerol-3-phosphate dehydrogenase [Herbaspirillum robiniae]|uniref:Glycerol-3-phosphate dehydrogenase n=1 Tax=Herbaspirillum robiniae TaxID=2014887 RepID=A0A246WSB1_9BURK|nr:glycerol-3-phosphate dehydrogenase [Herbaspirillum robiniae]OWY29298.1 glycerol-3-phosphate dehydrogenase [Herbaspirillum robiniae]
MALEYDLLVVGGGINGAGIARDAAGRGLRVILCEQHDLAQHTSSASTKLIHGGLRYLEYYEFKLVRKALQEREVLLRAAPHIIWPLRFVMPHDANQRPAWMIRAGLLMYDYLAKREILPASHGLNLREHAAGKPLKGGYRKGFVYSDGWVDDARLVSLNALDAHERGARILTRTRCVSARRDGDRWHAVLESEADGRTQVIEVRARAIVNAAGPWAARFAEAVPGAKKSYGLRLIKGSHIVVKRLFDHPYAYIFQNPDKRIIFAIPYQDDFTLIGTTDLEYHGDAGKVEISAEEVAYLCQMANRYFTRQISAQDVVWTYSGVRPLLDDSSENASAVTRDYLLELDDAGAPMLNVWGGKITTYRKLAEEAMAMLSPGLGVQTQSWTAGAPLPGGDLQQAGELVGRYDFDGFLRDFRARHPWLPDALARRYARSYGARAERLLAGAQDLAALGEELAPGLFEAEARYLADTEWARGADDILWRRSKLGLYCGPQHVARLEAWLAQHAQAGAHGNTQGTHA